MEQLAPAYLARAMEAYPQVTPLPGLTACVLATLQHAPPNSTVALYVVQALSQHASQLLAGCQPSNIQVCAGFASHNPLCMLLWGEEGYGAPLMLNMLAQLTGLPEWAGLLLPVPLDQSHGVGQVPTV